MSYNIKKQSVFTRTDNPSSQSISTSYTAITGSTGQIKLSRSTINVLYKFSFYVYNSDAASHFLHVKLQKSNDNFSSDINDISGCQINLSGDTQESNDKKYEAYFPMFIVENLDKEYLRLVVRSYSTSSEATLHRSTQWDGSTSADVYFNPTLTIVEI